MTNARKRTGLPCRLSVSKLGWWQYGCVCRRWALMHELLADVVEELLGRAAAEGGGHASVAADAWTLVTDIVTEPYRDNALGMHW